MTKMAKKELIKATKQRYLRAGKKEKGRILDEFCHNTSYNRKYAITILQAAYDNNKITNTGRKPRKKKYGHDVIAAIVQIWELLEYPCGARLSPSLASMAESLVRCGEKNISGDIMEKLKTISAKTLDRRLKKNGKYGICRKIATLPDMGLF